MNEFARIVKKTQTSRAITGKVINSAQSHRYDIQSSAGTVYRNIYSPWAMFIGDAVAMSVDHATHKHQVISHISSANASIKEVPV